MHRTAATPYEHPSGSAEGPEKELSREQPAGYWSRWFFARFLRNLLLKKRSQRSFASARGVSPAPLQQSRRRSARDGTLTAQEIKKSPEYFKANTESQHLGDLVSL